ncbi:hypothetical protein BOTBODRAFT_25796 [Botryobasidium botryosum FD-172 SS1]|uniref:non-specific serine/threonine protein kinase n=1 Tax=Botryobasidium botryosum (strain FD-172 SS1) TaxID=930990 RepID=A0A067NC84_BOTB1|nr:hypothetical protein BOTBODRAFT_25796 [Botryobasidium botryosum FD-172 SS1]
MPPNGLSSLNLAAAISAQAHLSVTQIFRKLEVVGKGGYGSVYKGVHIASGTVVALKIINLDTPDDDVEDIQKEVSLLSRIGAGDTNNLTSYYGCWLAGPQVWIVMDFASGGSLRTLMKASKSGTLEEKYVVVIVRESLVALSFLHKAGIIHRDIKAANILVTSTGKILLCDFGVSALLVSSQSKRTTFAGTPHWMAPEVITEGSRYDTKADIWSLGITIYEIFMGSPPHSELEQLRALVIIPKAKPARIPENQGSKELREFVANCLRELPADRPSSDELAKSKWIKAATKTPVSILRDLITRYESWQAGGGVRASLAGPDYHGDDIDDDFDDMHDANWEFETVKGRPDLQSDTNQDDLYDPVHSTQPSFSTTLGIPGQHNQPPRSLRHLFEDASAPAESGLRTPMALPRSPLMNGQSSPSLPPIPSPAPPTPFLGGIESTEQSESADARTARPMDFVSFVQRSGTPSNLSPPGTPKMEALDSPIASTLLASPHRRRHGTRSRSGSNANKDSTSIPIPPLPLTLDLPPRRSALTPPPPDDSDASSSKETYRSPPQHTRQHRDRDGDNGPSVPKKSTSPLKFRFPSPASSSTGHLPPLTPQFTPSPSFSEASSFLSATVNGNRSPEPSSLRHLPSHSIELNHKTSFLNRSPNLHPPILASSTSGPLPTSSSLLSSPNSSTLGNGRPSSAHSHGSQKPAILKKPMISRQASLAVMETTGDTTLASRVSVRPDRSGSGGSRSDGDYAAGSTLAVPKMNVGIGLRDVLKLLPTSNDRLGIQDLLPPSPSPSAVSPGMRAFGQYFPSQQLHSEPNSTLGYLNHQSSHHHHQSSTSSPLGMYKDSPDTGHSHSTSATGMETETEEGLLSSSTTSWLHTGSGPPIRPLDYSAILSSGDLLTELSHTVDDLAQWLGIVEGGLNAVLDPVDDPERLVIPEDEEEEEDDDEKFEIISPEEHLKSPVMGL